MRKILLATAFIAAAFCSAAQKRSAQNSADKKFDGLDTAFERVLKDWHAAGFAVAIVEKSKVVYAKGFGYRDIDKKSPVTPNTLFAIGSCTKAFTASILGMLREDGKVDLNNTVRTYLPDLKFYNDYMNDNIKVKDLMCHRTGLPRYDFSWYYFISSSRDSLMQRIQYFEPTAGLREKWQYNNFMFMLQGIIAEKITGKTWEENVRARILQPLGMTNTNFSVDTMAASADASVGYYVKKDSIIHKLPYYHIDALGPAGSINSNVNDMAKWVITWINSGKFNDKQIIPASYVPEAIGSQMVIDGGLPPKETPDLYFANYGYAWFLSSYRGHYRVEHGGNIDGFSASTSFFPSDSIGIIVLSNQNGSAVPSAVRNIIADKMLDLKYFDWETYLKKRADSANAAAKKMDSTKVSTRKLNTAPTHPLKDYEGIYTNKASGSIEVTLRHDSLFATLPHGSWWLGHYNYDVFTPYDILENEPIDTTDKGTPLRFNMNVDGDIDNISMELEPGIKAFVFTRSPKAKEISKDSLQKYTGEYTISTVSIKIYIKNDKSLFMSVPGQPEYELVATDKDKFVIKGLDGFKVEFNTNDKGEIIELLSIQPNGTFKAPKKK